VVGAVAAAFAAAVAWEGAVGAPLVEAGARAGGVGSDVAGGVDVAGEDWDGGSGGELEDSGCNARSHRDSPRASSAIVTAAAPVRLSQESDSNTRVTPASRGWRRLKVSRWRPPTLATTPSTLREPFRRAAAAAAPSKRRTRDRRSSTDGQVAGAVQRSSIPSSG